MKKNQFSLLDISMKSQNVANTAMLEKEVDLYGKELPLYKAFLDQEIVQTYILNLVRGTMVEYHHQLRAALAEKGIDIDNFDEIPLYPSHD